MKYHLSTLLILLITLTFSCEYLFYNPFGDNLSLEVKSRDLSDVLDNYYTDNIRLRVLTAEKGEPPAPEYSVDTNFIVLLLDNNRLLVFNDQLDLILDNYQNTSTSETAPEWRDFSGRLLCYNVYSNYFYVGHTIFNNRWEKTGVNNSSVLVTPGVSYIAPQADGANLLTTNINSGFSPNYVAIFEEPSQEDLIYAVINSDYNVTGDDEFQSFRTKNISWRYVTARSEANNIYIFYYDEGSSQIVVEEIVGSDTKWGRDLVSSAPSRVINLKNINSKIGQDDVFIINDHIYVKQEEIYICFNMDGSEVSDKNIRVNYEELIAVQDLNDGQIVKSDGAASPTYTYMSKHTYFYTFNMQTKRLTKNNLWF